MILHIRKERDSICDNKSCRVFHILEDECRAADIEYPARGLLRAFRPAPSLPPQSGLYAPELPARPEPLVPAPIFSAVRARRQKFCSRDCQRPARLTSGQACRVTKTRRFGCAGDPATPAFPANSAPTCIVASSISGSGKAI